MANDVRITCKEPESLTEDGRILIETFAEINRIFRENDDKHFITQELHGKLVVIADRLLVRIKIITNNKDYYKQNF